MARRRAVSAEDLYRLRFVSDAQISPDGTRVAYVVTWADDNRTRYRSQLMLAPVDGSRPPRPLTSGQHRDASPRWSPDGRELAFVSDRDADRKQIFRLSLSGGEPDQLTSLKHGAGVPVWSPAGDRLAFAASTDDPAIAPQEGQPDERGKPPRVKIITRVRNKADGEGFRQSSRRHLFVLRPGEEPRQLTDGDWDDGEPGWSPDGTWLAFVSNRERDRDLSLLSDVWVVPSTGGRARRLTRHAGQAAAPAWSPDGRSIAYLGHERGWTYGARTELLVVPATGGPSQPLSGPDVELGNVALTDARDPVPALAPRWLPDGRSLLALVSSAGQVSVVSFPIEGRPRALVEGDREVASFSASADGQRLVYVAADPTHPYEVFADERQVSDENASLLEELELAPVEPFEVRATDGETVHGWLMRPPRARGRSPLILEVHGGPEAMYAWSFMHEFQLLAARGYAVLYTNPRGSKGYGEAFTARIFADWGNQDAADCLAAVEAASGLPGIDAARLGVAGGSYGGFMTAWLVGHSDRFKAAVAMRGCYNLASFYGTSDIGPWFGDYILGGPPYEREALYRERSPLTYASRIRAPLLLIHSESDLRCPIEQAEQFFVHLRRLGRTETELIRFPEESHNLSRSGRPDRRVERLERILDWFDRFLRPGRPGQAAGRSAPQARPRVGAGHRARTASPAPRPRRAAAPRSGRSRRPSP
jgi:dipeptidyl aminopeptidase/acylaminoacyl peptidase